LKRLILRLTGLLLVIVLCLGAIGWFGQHDKVNNALYRAYYGDHGIPAVHRDVYEDAAATYDVDWRLLAAVHRVETIFSVPIHAADVARLAVRHRRPKRRCPRG